MDLLTKGTKEAILATAIHAGINYAQTKKLDTNEELAVLASCLASGVAVERFDVPIHIPYTTKQQTMAPLIYSAVKLASGERRWKALAIDNAKLVVSMKGAEVALGTLAPDTEQNVNRQRLPF